ncbi:hypothetical protein ACVPOR_00655 [Staphylococcus aureus]
MALTKTGDPLAPAYYLTAISVIGFLVITFLHLSTAGKSLKGSYPNVITSKIELIMQNTQRSIMVG